MPAQPNSPQAHAGTAALPMSRLTDPALHDARADRGAPSPPWMGGQVSPSSVSASASRMAAPDCITVSMEEKALNCQGGSEERKGWGGAEADSRAVAAVSL